MSDRASETKEDVGMQRQRGMMGGGQRGEMKYQLEAALFTRSFRMKKKVRPAELRNASSWPHSSAEAMGCVYMGTCTLGDVCRLGCASHGNGWGQNIYCT